MSLETPFQLHVSDIDLENLHHKLRLTRFPDELADEDWDYGVPLADIKRLVARWQTGFDWRSCERAINDIPQYTRDVDVDGFGTLHVHYVHQRSELDAAVPLLFVHGWPGHFLEARKLLVPLSSRSADHPSFHVVALSLPGFGFSEAPRRKGFGPRQYAEIANKLMISLGYSQYVVQGGDWGHVIAACLATDYAPTHVKGWLSNCPVALPPRLSTAPRLYLSSLITPYTAQERRGLAKAAARGPTDLGYFHQQATKPQTLGYSLADSPVGLLAWIYEKLIAWSGDYPWTDDEVLEWVSVYWFSRAGPAASVRIYREMTAGFALDPLAHARWTPVPFGVAYFPDEVVRAPRKWLQTLGNLVFESEHDRGGHFAAHEQPQALVDDVRRMFGRGGPAFGVVNGKSGYGKDTYCKSQ